MTGPAPSRAAGEPAPREAPPWHALPVAEALARLDASAHGLTFAQAAERLKRFGANLLPRAAPAPWWRIVVRQFVSPLIFILGFAAALSLAIGEIADAGFIFAVLVLNALIGGWQEWRAERSAHALRSLLQVRAAVKRDGDIREVPAESVVPGDVIWLESGSRVPADGRLLEGSGLEIDESLLTGESLPVEKDHGWAGEPATPMADRRNMVFGGSMVVRGRATAVVTATGLQSEVGRLAIDVQTAPSGRTPLMVRLDDFSRTIGIAAMAAVALVAVIGVVVHGHRVSEMALFGVALAVSVIPEGLPVAITIALAVASRKMARRGVIVRQLGAVEGLGSCTYIMSDKTGTLTCNELTARELRLAGGQRLALSGQGYSGDGSAEPPASSLAPEAREELEALVRVAVLCNEGDLHERDGRWVWRGDPTDVALLAMGRKLLQHPAELEEQFPEAGRIAFEPERQFAASYRRVGGAVRVLVKGAPERLLSMSAGGPAGAPAASIRAMAEDMAGRGQRVLAFAEGPAADLDPSRVPPAPSGLTLLGLVGMIDPLRPGAAEAVESARQAGIRVVMVTGDHPVTALAIARDLGMAERPDQVVPGAALGEDPARFSEAIDRARVFARVAPRQKLLLVEAAQAAGQFVAVTGDGTNDAPALRAANIGVAMGRSGTDVARDAADLVISDDDFATIVAGIEEGRVANDNIRKVIYLLVSTNGAEVLMAISAVAAGLPLPLLPVQLLWLNLVTEGLQHVALAFEPAEDGVLRRPPRAPREPIFNRLMVERVLVGSAVMAGVSLAAFWWMIRQGWALDEARNTLLLLMVLYENIQIGNSRSETRSGLALSPLRSPLLLSAAAAALAVHFLAMHWAPARHVLDTAPVDLRTWATLLLLALTVFVAMELHKLSWAWRRGRGAVPG